MKLFFCSTYYHTLITFIKLIEDGDRADIVLWNDIPEFDNLSERLFESGRLSNIYLYDAKRWKAEVDFNSKIKRLFLDKKAVKRSVPQLLDFKIEKLAEYADIYFYNDAVPPARYCIYQKIKYHLIEDALDYFTYFDMYWNISESSFSKNGWRKWVKKILGTSVTPWGQNDCCIDIEVNNKNSIKIPKDKVIECSRKEMFDNLSEQDKKIIYAIYAGESKVAITCNNKSVIIFTQPLFADGFVSSIAKQLFVFECVILEYRKKNFQVTLKPHPRDLADYTSIIKKYDCGYIDKNMPSEILNFDSDVVYDEAVSITSTAINFLKNVKVKRFLGREYVDLCLMDFSSR